MSPIEPSLCNNISVTSIDRIYVVRPIFGSILRHIEVI